MTNGQTRAVVIDLPAEEVDRIYAQSLFEVVEAKGGRPLLEEISDELQQIAEETGKDPLMREFFNSKVITAADKARVLGLGFKGRMNELVFDFTQVLARRERLDRFRRIVSAFDQMMQDRFGIVEVDVYTRYPLGRDEIEGIRSTLHAAMKREPVVHAYTDDTMIGGIRIQVGDKLLDATVDAKLRHMRTRLREGGGDALRSRIDRIIEG